jgi:hypothetical protein
MSDPENTAAVRAHRATLITSETTRQVNIAAALVRGGSAATVRTAVAAEDIAHYRRLLASAKSNSVTIPTTAIEALQELGTGGA